MKYFTVIIERVLRNQILVNIKINYLMKEVLQSQI